jgi:hypothetical protein
MAALPKILSVDDEERFRMAGKANGRAVRGNSYEIRKIKLCQWC